MKLLSDWGITGDWWRGLRGEYWVIVQGLLTFGFVILPTERPSFIDLESIAWHYAGWSLTVIFGVFAVILLGRSLIDLGQNLTLLPHPKNNGQLVQTGIYGLVRHPIYSGVIFLALAYAGWQVSWVHLFGAIALFVFLMRRREKKKFG